MRIITLILGCIVSFILLEAQPDSITVSPVQQANQAKEESYNTGLNLYRSEKFSEAILSFDTCLMIDSSFKEARFLKALSLEKRGDLKEAVLEFEIIKREDPRYDDIDKRIKNYYLTVYLSKNWYYMLAMLFLVILFMAVIVKTIAYRKLQ